MLHSDEFFRQFPIFKDLSEEEIKRLKDISIQRSYKQGQIIFRQHEPRHTVYFSLSGLIKISKIDCEGHEQIVNVLHSDEMFPHVGFFDNTPYPATALTITDAEIVSVPIEEFELLLLEKPDISIKVMRVIGQKLLELQERLQTVQTQDVFHRIVMMLIRFAKEIGVKHDDNQVSLNLPITNQELANMVGVSRETVNRTFNRLKKEEIMTYNRKEIQILDYKKLESYWIH